MTHRYLAVRRCECDVGQPRAKRPGDMAGAGKQLDLVWDAERRGVNRLVAVAGEHRFHLFGVGQVAPIARSALDEQPAVALGRAAIKLRQHGTKFQEGPRLACVVPGNRGEEIDGLRAQQLTPLHDPQFGVDVRGPQQVRDDWDVALDLDRNQQADACQAEPLDVDDLWQNLRQHVPIVAGTRLGDDHGRVGMPLQRAGVSNRFQSRPPFRVQLRPLEGAGSVVPVWCIR